MQRLLLSVKIIPMAIAFCCVINSILSYFYIDIVVLNYFGGISFLTLYLLYCCSYAFDFCNYHRMFIHYITVYTVLSTIDYYIGFPISDLEYLMLMLILAGIFLFIILYLKFK